ncbi:radical SAM protein [Sulfurospirillum multivorans]|uniref:Radical SAM family protein n=2 Tax=Sulfurospirillum multivorans TaxID=66821 RepID=A0AA86DYM4_SULMK|nr:radical SAM protein [Sulfurospirillum multivorans]AHJ11550.1 radical SAM family protein [Sulfurospirillum multivorans DSM 12446]QEH05051.1 radical SAM family protein [Sulfurospirillum multivorans]
MIPNNLATSIQMYNKIENDFINSIEQQYGLKFDKHNIYSSDRMYSPSEYINFKSSACIACEKGIDSRSDFLSLKCNKSCYFCFNPNQIDFLDNTQNIKKGQSIANHLLKENPRIQYVALTGGEPLLHKKEAINFFQRIERFNSKIHKRLYTNGELIDTFILKKLKNCNLQEIRFSIKLEDSLEKQADILEKIEEARYYIPDVIVEMPVIPKTYSHMENIITTLESIGVRGINLLEFCFPLHNEKEFIRRGFLLKYPPFQVYYNYWYSGGLAIAGSEEDSLKLLRFAKQNNFKMGIHYCSLANKHLGQIYQYNTAYPIDKWFYLSEKDYFLKSAKVYDNDIHCVEHVLRKNNLLQYNKNDDYNFLEFHPKYITLFDMVNIDIGMSYNIIEEINSNVFIKELKIEKIDQKNFILQTI